MSQNTGLPRILVTGAAGFLGSRVVRQLTAMGCQVIALVRPRGNRERLADIGDTLCIVEGDFHRPAEWANALTDLRPPVLLHLAWHTEPGKYRGHTGNLADLTASLTLVQRAPTWGCIRIVGVGTCLEYDTRPGYLSEEVPLAPRCVYESSKAALYLAASAWARGSGVSFAWARLFYQFGPGEDVRRLVPSVVTALLAGRPVALTSGVQVRDYLHVDDVAAAIAQLALVKGVGPFNVGSGRPVSVRDLVRLVENEAGRTGLVHFGELPDPVDDPPFICATTARVRAATGWEPTRSLEAGIAETVGWWAKRGANSSNEALE